MLRFSPPLPADREEMLDAFATEPVTKLVYVFRRRPGPPAFVRAVRAGPVPLWVAATGPDDAPAVLLGTAAGARARALDEMPAVEAVQYGLEDLAETLGVAITTLKVAAAPSLS
jgi:monoamine oxidase